MKYKVFSSIVLTLLMTIYVHNAQAEIKPNIHPVALLVEAELTDNVALKRPALERMARYILAEAEVNSIPKEILERFDIYKFRSQDWSTQVHMLQTLSVADLKKLVILPAPLHYFEIRESVFEQLGKLYKHELDLAGLSDAKELLQFKRGKDTFIRWPVHPLADPQGSEVLRILDHKFGFAPSLKKGDLKFHFTASRSIIVFSNGYDTATSLKVSLPKSEGPFSDKAIHTKEWRAWSQHNDWIKKTTQGVKFKHLELQYEPFGIAFDQEGRGEDGLISRDIGPIRKGERYLLPAFAILSDNFGREIAKLNGATPFEFWEEHFIKPFAKGMAELRAYTGAEHTSPHTQNVLVEFDLNFKPTGKIVIRDFDFYIDQPVFDALNRWGFDSKGLVKPGPQRVLFSLQNGLHELPTWLDKLRYNRWIEKYFAYYRDEFSRVTSARAFDAFHGSKILKYSYWGYKPVTEKDYIHGGYNNFHTIEFVEEHYKASYLQWVTARNKHLDRAEKMCRAFFN